MEKTDFKNKNVKGLRLTLVLAALALTVFLAHFISRPLGSGSFLLHRLVITLVAFACTVFAGVLFLRAGRKPDMPESGRLRAEKVHALFALLSALWFVSLLFCSVFSGVPFLNGDVVLGVSVAMGIVTYRMLAYIDRGGGESRIRLQHKIVFALLVLFIAGEVLLRIFAGKVFPDSPEARMRSYLRWAYFTDKDEEKRQKELARRWLKRSVPARVPDPGIGFILNPAAFPDYPNVFDPERHSTPAAEGVYRVVCIGGSAVFYAYPRFLGDALGKEFPSGKFDVIDAAVPGYTCYYSFLNYRHRVAASKPDLVIIYHGINELKYLFSPGLKEDYGHFGLPWLEEENIGGASGLLRRLAVVRFINLTGMRIIAKPQTPPVWSAELSDRAREVASGHMMELIKEIRKSGAKPVLCTFPIMRGGKHPPQKAEKIENHLYQYAPGLTQDEAAGALEILNSDLRKQAEENDILLLDLEKDFPRKLEYFIDCCHYSDRGASLLAGKIAAFLKSNSLVSAEKQ
ncbi:MAG: SGNH/GDSL hydrolase family protein [Planctomycetota bacterium]|jgi:hypothetical protein